ncbi:hypothetical protein [Pantoea agglomerans]|uniref:hypothetical protein n=1 Tax=Enterobacter agglomerans TaxID=549 RepID=UPI001CBB3D86|nr:hypothetical protein [Pantoea agglomerans]
MPNPPVALCQRPHVINVIQTLLERRSGDNLPPPAIYCYRSSERRVYVTLSRHD